MAIDIRATTTCTLGTLISASITDDYIQGNGLVKTKGSCEISGTIVPAPGTVVTFSYTKGGVTRTLPRKLRVLSSFADPFRRTTKVELGCKLTFLQDVSKLEQWRPEDDPANAGFDEADSAIITFPISAKSIAEECLAQLEIAHGTIPLTNSFSIAKFDFSSGYVSILGDLLVSECYCGYLDFDEELQLINLSETGGTGPVITSAKIIDVAPIGVGQLPADAVTVSYSSLRLNQPEQPDPDAPTDPEDPPTTQQQKNWEKEETIGPKATVYVSNPFFTNNPFPTAQPEFFEFTYTPRSVTETTYDTYDRVVTRTTTEYTILADIAPGAIQQDAINGPALGNDVCTIVTTERYNYKLAAPNTAPSGDPPEGYEEVVTKETIVEEPEVKMVASTQLFDIAGQANEVYPVSLTPFIASKTIERQEAGTTRAGTPCTKTITESYKAYGYTLEGQQQLATGISRNSGNFDAAAQYLIGARKLASDGVTTVIATGRDIGLQQRPSAADRNNAENVDDTGPSTAPKPDPTNGWRTSSESGIEIAVGTVGSKRVIRLSLPYSPDDIFSKSGTPPSVTYSSVRSDAPEKARAYGRAQNRLLHGNRFGANFQMAPETLPDAPFAPFIIQANGLSALYRNNGTGWTLSSDGVLVSTDALFWGAVGGTGTFWFPVAPGITTLPTTPPVVDGEMTVTNPVPAWNETVPLEGTLVLGASVTSLPYALELLTPLEASTVIGASITTV